MAMQADKTGSAVWRLWDDELEAHRDEARSLLDFVPLFDPTAATESEDVFDRAVAVREVMDSLTAQSPVSKKATDITISGPGGELPLRLFVPDEPQGMMLHAHGGGWVVGSPTMTDTTNERLSRTHRLVVASVDYRLAPEHPYPAAPDDCEAAALWLLNRGPDEWRVDELLLAGESAGAHLAAVTMLRLRDRHDAIEQVLGANLVFGSYDLRRTPSACNNGGHRDMLSPAGMQYSAAAFTAGMSDAQRRDPDVSPLFADLRGLPPCLLSVGSYDHLLDDSLFFAARLAAAETPVELAVYPDSPHGFTLLPSKMTQAHTARVDKWIKARLA